MPVVPQTTGVGWGANPNMSALHGMAMLGFSPQPTSLAMYSDGAASSCNPTPALPCLCRGGGCLLH